MGEHDETLHVRCDGRLKRVANRAAALNDQSMSDWVRETLREAAEEQLPEAAQPEN